MSRATKSPLALAIEAFKTHAFLERKTQSARERYQRLSLAVPREDFAEYMRQTEAYIAAQDQRDMERLTRAEESAETRNRG